MNARLGKLDKHLQRVSLKKWWWKVGVGKNEARDPTGLGNQEGSQGLASRLKR